MNTARSQAAVETDRARSEDPSRAKAASTRRRLLALAVASLVFLSPLIVLPVAGSNPGNGWQPAGLQGESVIGLTVASSQGDRLIYAETANGMWRYAAGDGWTRIDQTLPRIALGSPALAAWRVVPGRTRQLFALTGSGTARQLYRSDDGGDSWRLIGPAPGQTARPAMVVTAGLGGAPDAITLATDTRVQRSTDGGNTWFPGGAWPVTEEEPESPASAPEIMLGDGNAPDRIAALSADGNYWLSESGGLSWRIVRFLGGAEDDGVEPVYAVAITPYFGIRLWVATASRVMYSTDNGATWTQYPLPGDLIARRMGGLALLTDPRVPETLYLSKDGEGVYRSDESGASWAFLGKPGGAQTFALALDPDSRAMLYAATDDGIWVKEVRPLTPAPVVIPTRVEITDMPTATVFPTRKPTATPTATATPTLAPTATATATSTPAPSPTARPTWTPTRPAPTETSVPIAEPTERPHSSDPQPTSAPPATPRPYQTPSDR